MPATWLRRHARLAGGAGQLAALGRQRLRRGTRRRTPTQKRLWSALRAKHSGQISESLRGVAHDRGVAVGRSSGALGPTCAPHDAAARDHRVDRAPAARFSSVSPQRQVELLGGARGSRRTGYGRPGRRRAARGPVSPPARAPARRVIGTPEARLDARRKLWPAVVEPRWRRIPRPGPRSDAGGAPLEDLQRSGGSRRRSGPSTRSRCRSARAIPSAFLDALGERERLRASSTYSPRCSSIRIALFTRPVSRCARASSGRSSARCATPATTCASFRPTSGASRGSRGSSAPRVMATSAAPPDRGRRLLSLSLHAGATVEELHRCGARSRAAADGRSEPALSAHARPPARAPARARHATRSTARRERPRAARAARGRARSDVERAIAAARAAIHPRRRDAPDRDRRDPGRGRAACSPRERGGDYGVHSEMFTTALMQLHRAGKVSNRRKGLLRRGSRSRTFAMGTRALYDWLDGEAASCALPAGRRGERSDRDRRNRADDLAQRRASRSISRARWWPTRSTARSTRGSAATRTSSRARRSARTTAR